MDLKDRRKFLATCLGGIAAIATVGVLYPLYRYLAPAAGGEGSAKVTVPDGEVKEGAAKFIQYNGSAAVLVRKRGGELAAFSAVCTHLGCIVQWQQERQQFLCPCHGGLFSADGAVVAGPPPKPLQKLPLAVANGVITVG